MDVVYTAPTEFTLTGSINYVGNYAPETVAFLNRLNTQPSSEIKALYDYLYTDIGDLIADMDFLYMGALAPSEPDSFENLCGTEWTLQKFGGVTFVPGRGWKGNGVDGFLTAGFIPNENTHYQRDDSSAGASIYDMDGTANKVRTVMGGNGTSGSLLINPDSAANNGRKFRIQHNASQTFTSASTAISHWYVTRDGAAAIQWRDMVNVRLKTEASSAIAWHDTGLCFLAASVPKVDGVPTAGTFSTIGLSSIFGGRFFNEEELTRIYTALNYVLAQVGAEELYVPTALSARISITPHNAVATNVITYRLSLFGTGAIDGTLDIEQDGDYLDAQFNKTFVQAIADGVALTPGITFDGVKTLTFTSAFAGILTFSRTLTTQLADIKIHNVKLSNSSYIKIKQPFTIMMTGTPTVPTITPMLKGTNLSGMEFDGWALYPSQADVDYYFDRGFNCLRLPHRWPRLQHTLFGDLDTVGNNPMQGLGDATNYKALVDYITNTKGMYCIIDPHDFGGRDGKKINDDPEMPVEAFVDYWEKLLDFLGHNDKIIYNIINEPSGQNGDNWRCTARVITDAIRKKGYYNVIHVPGTSYTAAHNWVSSGNASRFADFKDPANNFVFEVHQYLDATNEGANGICAVNSQHRLEEFTAWCKTFTPHAKAFLGEFAAGYPTVTGQEQCATEFPAMLQYMEDNPTVWSGSGAGWGAWGGGRFWNTSYHFRNEPPNKADPNTPLMEMLLAYV